MKRVRHWKQRFDPDAKFVFLRRLKLGLDPKRPIVVPGDPVPTGDVRLGRARIKRWWHAGIIGLADFKYPEELKREKREADRKVATEAVFDAAKRLPELVERLEAAQAEAEPSLDVLANTERELNELKAVFEKAVELGVEIPADVVTALDTFDLPVEDEEEAEGFATATRESLPEGVTITSLPEGGYELSMPESEAQVFETIEEALAVASGGVEAQEPKALTDEILVEPTGGGWFAVTVPGEAEPRKVQGEAKLEALLDELRAEPEGDAEETE